MLTVILAVTLAVADPAATADAYRRHLDYRIADRGTVPAELAAAWGTPAAAGADYVLLQPASGEPVYLRILRQDPASPPAAAMRTSGWNANEILVEDPVALRARLEGSPFRIVGEPRGLDFNPAVIAMQALGPAGELVYFTRIPSGRSQFNLGSARSFVDRTFIVVVGGPDIEALRRYYADGLGLPVTPAQETQIRVLSNSWQRPAETRWPIAIASLPQGFLIEIDGYPAEAGPRPAATGALPPGIAMVSFGVRNLDTVRVPLLGQPLRRAEAPYFGRRVATARGAAGELLELVERLVP